MKSTIPFIIIAICIGSYFLYISPTWEEVNTLIAKKAEYTDVLEKTKELKHQRDVALATYNNISAPDLDRLNKVIPKKFDPVFFANDVNNLASKNGLNVKTYNISPVTEDRDVQNGTVNNQYKTLSLAISLTGSYEQFDRFLQQLESSLQLVDVAGLQIKTTTGGGKSGDKEAVLGSSLDYTLDIRVYSL